MVSKRVYQFYVEGEDEKKVVETLKKDLKVIVSGKVDVINVIQEKISSTRIRVLKPGTVVVLVYDTDIEKTDILEKNLEELEASNHIRRIICVPQVMNLEDELVRATQVHQAKDILKSKTITDFKRDLIKCSNLWKKLQENGFDISKFWSVSPANSFAKYGNESSLIKK